MITAQKAWHVFERATADYHVTDAIEASYSNPYAAGSLEAILYDKNRVDASQWHMEDLIRDPGIDPVAGMELKHQIDRSNQVRTDMVEAIDDKFLETFRNVTPASDATINTESPAWALDRLSILALKIWHMAEQVARTDVGKTHHDKCLAKLEVLKEQQQDLTQAIDALLTDMARGRKYMKVYRQMKMYNDESTNPVLYNKK